ARADTGDPVAIRDHAIVELLYASALRVSELAGLTLRDIDHGRLTLRVTGKGSKERVVPYGTPARDALERYLGEAREPLRSRRTTTAPADPGEAVFLGARGAPINERTI